MKGILIIISLLFCPISLLPNRLNPDGDFGEYNTFQSLDSCVLHKQVFEQQKQNRIKERMLILTKADSPQQKYDCYTNLFREYETYMYDSAYAYSRKMHDLAIHMNIPEKIIEAKMIMAYCNISAGLFLEAKDILTSLDLDKLSDSQKIFYYSINAKLYLDNAEFIRVNPYFTEYNNLSIDYSQKIISTLDENAEGSVPHWANIYKCKQDYKKAITILKGYADKANLSDRSKTLCYGGIGSYLLMDGDTVEAIPYLIYTAKADIKSVTKETPALSILAQIAYRQNKIDRAYLYAKSSLEDATQFNARHRKIEIGDILPIIESSRFGLMEKQKNYLFIYGIAVSALVLLLIFSIIFIRRKIKQLKKARKLNIKQNKELHKVNLKLKEVNKIKNEYIGHSFSTNSDLIADIEEFQKQISRKVAARQYNDILSTMKYLNMNKEREKTLISFDKVFLKIFPNFVEQYNHLFEIKYQVKMENEQVLTPEMRIFALIRLGITDSDRVAKMLNYSVHTINTYKTKVKNKSLVSNDQFENEIMKIGAERNIKD